MTWAGFVGKISTTAASYASGIDLGVLEEVRPVLSSPLSVMSFPGLSAKEQESMDDSGASLTISIKGVKTASTMADLIAWQESIYALIDGNQYWANEFRYLAIYISGYYTGTGNHLWYLRDDITIAQDSSGNLPIAVILETFEPMPKGGDTVACEYTLKMNQQCSYWA